MWQPEREPFATLDFEPRVAHRTLGVAIQVTAVPGDLPERCRNSLQNRYPRSLRAHVLEEAQFAARPQHAP